jgi:hypothetical protein
MATSLEEMSFQLITGIKTAQIDWLMVIQPVRHLNITSHYMNGSQARLLLCANKYCNFRYQTCWLEKLWGTMRDV